MPVRSALIAVAVLARAVAVGRGAERAITTCGERFPKTSGALRSAAPPEELLRGSDFLVDARRRELADARAVRGGLGLGEPV